MQPCALDNSNIWTGWARKVTIGDGVRSGLPLTQVTRTGANANPTGTVATYTGTTLGIGLTAIGTNDDMSAGDNLQMAGAAALGGLALGTLFQVASYMQEDVEAVDGKVAQLDLLHNEMIATLRVLADRKVSASVNEHGEVAAIVSSSDMQFEMSRVIQDFINKAKLINVKG